MAKNLFCPFPHSEQVFFAISLFAKATLDKEDSRGEILYTSPEGNLVILVHFIFDRFVPFSIVFGSAANPF